MKLRVSEDSKSDPNDQIREKRAKRSICRSTLICCTSKSSVRNVRQVWKSPISQTAKIVSFLELRYEIDVDLRVCLYFGCCLKIKLQTAGRIL